jgi:ribonuclease R
MLGADSRIDVGSDGRIRLPEYGDEVVGRFRLNPRGFGFVIPDHPFRDGDLFVPRGSTRDAISGDRVRAAVIHQKWRSRTARDRSPYIGRVMEVLERGQEQFVGVLVKDKRRWFVEPDGRSLRDPVLIRDGDVKSARPGDKVVIELVHYPEEEYHAEGVITKVLGAAGEPDVETQAVIEAHGLRTEFPKATVDEARKAGRTFEQDAAAEQADREDLTKDFIFTIDPPDAKDFDDAISIAHDEATDEWTLGVHIADVAHFVRPGSALDREGQARGNSVYLPRLVIPMLPEVLSNGVCSLQEGVRRFARSVWIRFDRRGKVLDQRCAATVISSRKRLTYLEAQALIDGDAAEARRHAKTEPEYPDELVTTLKQADKLARLLRKRRLRDGMIVLNLPEVELVFDDEGRVVDAVPEDDAFTHKIIEMFMVEANEAIARLFDSLGVPLLRRIHPDPVHGDLTELRMYAAAAHQEVPDRPTRHDIQRLLEATADTSAARAIHFAVLRTLTKATYSPAMIGHYALASDHYAHFTSPIRRYPDLTVHRALAAFLDATDNGRKVPGGRKRAALAQRIHDDARVHDEAELIRLGRHCSDTEIEAEQAERELREFLVMQFLEENHLGDEFAGVVTGITGGGVFVEIDKFLVEGMVRAADMPAHGDRPDQWVADDRTGRLVAKRSGAALGVGDIVTVQIVRVDLASRHLDLAITQLPQRTDHAHKEKKHKEPKKKRPAAAGKRGKEKGKRKGHGKGRRGRKGR